MTVSMCRVCGNKFYNEPLAVYRNMPGSAQNFPDKENLENDKGIDLKVFQCSGCGLIQLDSDPVHYYREVIRAAGFSDEMKSFRRKQFEEFLTKYNIDGQKLIEIGCGSGEYLSIMNEFNIDSYGLEYAETSVDTCVENGLAVSKGFFESSSFLLSDAPFNAFMIMSFLEHIPDPNTVLRGIWNNLTDQGVGIVEVPNFDMIVKNNLFSEFISDHLLYFTKDTLESILKINGFEVIECNSIWYDYILSAVVMKRDQSDLSGLKKYGERLIEEIDKFLNPFDSGKVAIWGAGHQALTVLSMLESVGKIKYVVDSADFKQGKFTPSTHIPIVSSDSLYNEPVDAVIIMAASYSDEVAGILKEMMGDRVSAAILRKHGLEQI